MENPIRLQSRKLVLYCLCLTHCRHHQSGSVSLFDVTIDVIMLRTITRIDAGGMGRYIELSILSDIVLVSYWLFT